MASPSRRGFPFNTTFAKTLVAGGAAGQTLDVLIAGDDEGAKQTVAALVESGGMRPIDVGPLKRARQLEQMGMFRHGTHDWTPHLPFPADL